MLCHIEWQDIQNSSHELTARKAVPDLFLGTRHRTPTAAEWTYGLLKC